MGGRVRQYVERTALGQPIARGVPYPEEVRHGRVVELMDRACARRVDDEFVGVPRISLYARQLGPQQLDEKPRHKNHNQKQVTHGKHSIHARTYV